MGDADVVGDVGEEVDGVEGCGEAEEATALVAGPMPTTVSADEP